jgi:hypothetical protein
MKSSTASETNKIVLARSCLLLPLLIKKRMYRKCFWMQCKWRQLQGASEPKVLLPSTSIGFRKRECSAGCSQHCRTRCLEIQCLTWARTHLKVLERAQSVVSARGDPSWTSVSFFFSRTRQVELEVSDVYRCQSEPNAFLPDLAGAEATRPT